MPSWYCLGSEMVRNAMPPEKRSLYKDRAPKPSLILCRRYQLIFNVVVLADNENKLVVIKAERRHRLCGNQNVITLI